MSDLAKIRARETDPATAAYASATADRITARVDPQRIRVYGTMARHMPGAHGKVDMLRGMAAELSNAAKGIVPCSRGCSKCCHMPVMLTADEAAVIAAETGAALVEPAAYYQGGDTDQRYNGQPCPFLREHQCSIYEQRPFACRLHINIDRDNTLCEVIPGETIRVPRLDTFEFDVHYVKAFGDPLTVKIADIREFFPKGLSK